MNLVEGPVRLAIAKGRLFETVRDLLAATDWGEGMQDVAERSLLVPLSDKLELLVVRAVDVPTYVARGAAHVGICGLDTILECQAHLIELLDLGIGACRLCLCGPKGAAGGSVRSVATKFPYLTKTVLERSGRSADIVKLGGALELAPLVDLADAIVDLVETGRTLEDNGLEVWEDLLPISTRLFTSEAALMQRRQDISQLADDLAALLLKRSVS